MQRTITRFLLPLVLLIGLGLVLWLAALDTPRIADGQTDRSWVAGYLDDQHEFGQYVNLPPEGLAGVRLWLPRPVIPGTGELIVHVRSANSGPDRATAHVAVAALAQHGPTDFRFTALQADPLRDQPITPLLLVLESRGVDRANAVSVIAGHNRYSNGLLIRDGRELPRADLAFEPLYAASWLDRLLPITRIAQHRPGIFGWPPLYALLAYVLLLALGRLIGLLRAARVEQTAEEVSTAATRKPMRITKVFVRWILLFRVLWFQLLMICICVLFSFILYSPVLDSYFVAEDLYNVNFRWPEATAEFSSTGPIIGYRPGSVVYLVVNNLLWGRNPIGHHAVAILLHGLVGSITFLIVRRVTRESLTAILAAMIFVGAPVHSEAVIWLAAAAGTVTSGLICMVAAWLWVRDSPKPSQLMVGLVATLYLLALLVKEVAFPLPALLILLDWAMKRIPSLKTPKIVVSQLFFYWPFGLAVGVYAFLHWQAGALGSSFNYGVNLNAGFEQISKGWSWYASSLFQPLSSFVNLDAVYWIWLGIFLVLLYVIGRARWASIWVLIALLPGATAYGERLTYLATVGFSIVVAVGLVDLARLFSSWLKPKFKEVYFLFAIGICVFVIFLLIADIYKVRQREANWIEAGRLTWTIPRRAKSLLPELPARAELYFVDLPDNVNGAFAFHWGIEPEVRYVYHNSRLIVSDVTHDPSQWSKLKVSSIKCKTDAPRFFFQYFAPTDELRLVTLPELSVDCR